MGTGGGNTPLLIVGVDAYNQALTGDNVRTLLAGHTDKDGVPCVAINLLQDAVPNEKVSPCLSTGNPKTGQANVAVCYPKIYSLDRAAFNQGENAQYKIQIDESGIAHTLVAKGPGAVCYPVKQKWEVRRVTPLECARLQGMPDWWCKDIKHSDSAAYKMWGNGMALPCVLYVMQGIAMQQRKTLLSKLEVMK